VRLFEIGTRFSRGLDGQVAEQKMIAGLVVGARCRSSGAPGARPADFFDVKGDVSALLALGGWSVHRFEAIRPGLPASGARGEDPARRRGIGVLGELHPGLTAGAGFYICSVTV
jgi:phenylalanyl-tRNA synthetase beta chain